MSLHHGLMAGEYIGRHHNDARAACRWTGGVEKIANGEIAAYAFARAADGSRGRLSRSSHIRTAAAEGHIAPRNGKHRSVCKQNKQPGDGASPKSQRNFVAR